jgi:hypothetical protein
MMWNEKVGSVLNDYAKTPESRLDLLANIIF